MFGSYTKVNFTFTIKEIWAHFLWNKSSRVPGLLSAANGGTKQTDENSIVQKKTMKMAR